MPFQQFVSEPPSSYSIIFILQISLWLQLILSLDVTWLMSPSRDISRQCWWSGLQQWTEIGDSWPQAAAAAESSAHKAGKPNDSKSLMSELIGRSVGLAMGFWSGGCSLHRGVKAHAEETQSKTHICARKWAAWLLTPGKSNAQRPQRTKLSWSLRKLL